ncbi:aromatic amino acid transaminase [Marinomonas sp. 2405UD66-6]|uniref:amino acid aminotransferase n=1 Tax=Marinomonas sp. 2405UD66-6 TaxID=3391834 RepID=UPI0039C8FA9E
MLAQLPHMKGDPLWQILSEFNEDSRAEKIDLLVGVYRDETGHTPMMKKVQEAEKQLAEEGASKAYRMLSGNMTFNRQIAKFLLGNNRLDDHCTIQTVGGSGALRVLADFIAKLSPQATVWNTEPGYLNHRPLMEGAGLTVEPFRWEDKGGQLDIEKCLMDLEGAKEGDILLLHGCCHNPTGIDPTLDQWQEFIDLCQNKNLIPLIDMAYQGFGDEPSQDAAGLRLVLDQMDFVLIASSCSKNMGLYCERTGAALVVTKDQTRHNDIRALLELITRANYSMPPDHGSAIAAMLLDDPKDWLRELATYRNRVIQIRQALTDALMALGAPEAFRSIAKQKGMFSLLPLSQEQMMRLKEEFAIYGVPNGRVNIAGLNTSQIPRLAQAIMAVV